MPDKTEMKKMKLPIGLLDYYVHNTPVYVQWHGVTWGGSWRCHTLCLKNWRPF